MNKFTLTLLSITLMAVFAVKSTSATAAEFSDAQKAEIEKIVKDYLLENGQTILESVNRYQAELAEKERAEAAIKAKAFAKEIENADLPFAGNKNGDVTIVEFFDYNCGYCRKALTELKAVLKDDKNVKVIFMDMPILGAPSREAAKWSLAAHRQGKYFEYHQALLEHNGPKNAENLERLAKKSGLDVEKMKKDKDDAAISEKLDEYITTAQELGVRGTPGFIIQENIFPGYMPANQIKEAIAKARNQ